MVETFRRRTFAFPEPMPAEEAATALAFSDAEIRDGDVVIDFGLRWGGCLDRLILGEIDGLLIDGRINRERDRTRPIHDADDPAVTAYGDWVAADAFRRTYCARGEDIPQDAADAEDDALLALTRATATTLHGQECQLRAGLETDPPVMSAEPSQRIHAEAEAQAQAGEQLERHGPRGNGERAKLRQVDVMVAHGTLG